MNKFRWERSWVDVAPTSCGEVGGGDDDDDGSACGDNRHPNADVEIQDRVDGSRLRVHPHLLGRQPLQIPQFEPISQSNAMPKRLLDQSDPDWVTEVVYSTDCG